MGVHLWWIGWRKSIGRSADPTSSRYRRASSVAIAPLQKTWGKVVMKQIRWTKNKPVANFAVHPLWSPTRRSSSPPACTWSPCLSSRRRRGDWRQWFFNDAKNSALVTVVIFTVVTSRRSYNGQGRGQNPQQARGGSQRWKEISSEN